MALHRRPGPAPYEVASGKSSAPAGIPMRGSGAARADAASTDRPAAASGHDGSYGDWRDFGGAPVALRLPRGYVAVLGVVLILVIVLAYAVGHSQGYRRAEEVAKQKFEQDLKQTQSAPLPEYSGSGATGANPFPGVIPSNSSGTSSNSTRRLDPNAPAKAATGAGNPANSGVSSTPGPVAKEPAEPRYLQLARYPEKDANRLVAFLKKHGVEAAVIPTDNARLFLVVDQTAFDAKDIRNRAAEYVQHRDKLRQLGRLWKEKEKGPTDLADMTPQVLPGR